MSVFFEPLPGSGRCFLFVLDPCLFCLRPTNTTHCGPAVPNPGGPAPFGPQGFAAGTLPDGKVFFPVHFWQAPMSITLHSTHSCFCLDLHVGHLSVLVCMYPVILPVRLCCLLQSRHCHTVRYFPELAFLSNVRLIPVLPSDSTRICLCLCFFLQIVQGMDFVPRMSDMHPGRYCTWPHPLHCHVDIHLAFLAMRFYPLGFDPDVFFWAAAALAW